MVSDQFHEFFLGPASVAGALIGLPGLEGAGACAGVAHIARARWDA